MSEPTFTRERPNRLRSWLLSAPVHLYRGWLGALISRRHILKLTTTGRRSGLPRATLVSYLPLDGAYVVASGWGTRGHWYRNLRADPHVTVQLGRHQFPATAHPVLDPARRRELMLAMRDFSAHCGPPPQLRPLLRRLYDYDASIRLAVAHAEELPVVEIVPDDKGRGMRVSSMVEHQFTEDRLAALYDVFYPPERRDDFAFYLPLVLAARSVLDVGCGTGALLRMAREAGHVGRLSGLDPAEGMLNQARQEPSIEWVHGDLSSIAWDREFDLIVMTGHAFQEFVEDDEIRVALAAIRSALTDDGRFAFETRNPLDRAWERWPAAYSGEATDATGAIVRCEYQVQSPVVGNVVRTSSTFTSPGWDHPEVSHGALRFLDAATLSTFLTDAGLLIEQQFGDWTRALLSDTLPEIITIARKG